VLGRPSSDATIHHDDCEAGGAPTKHSEAATRLRSLSQLRHRDATRYPGRRHGLLELPTLCRFARCRRPASARNVRAVRSARAQASRRAGTVGFGAFTLISTTCPACRFDEQGMARCDCWLGCVRYRRVTDARLVHANLRQWKRRQRRELLLVLLEHGRTCSPPLRPSRRRRSRLQ
jgi:hypothetical protein